MHWSRKYGKERKLYCPWISSGLRIRQHWMPLYQYVYLLESAIFCLVCFLKIYFASGPKESCRRALYLCKSRSRSRSVSSLPHSLSYQWLTRYPYLLFSPDLPYSYSGTRHRVYTYLNMQYGLTLTAKQNEKLTSKCLRDGWLRVD
jgi:hypothetical protein